MEGQKKKLKENVARVNLSECRNVVKRVDRDATAKL
jgi:hypothetical protein